jgi:long-chain fatty acid transport protein
MSSTVLRTSTVHTITVVTTCLALSAWADGFRNPPESASAMGRIGGKIAQIDDASAVTINPANMTELDHTQAMGSLTIGYGEKAFSSAVGIDTTSDKPWSYLPSIFVAGPLQQENWAAGLGITVPFGRFTDYTPNAFFGEMTPYYSSLSVININPAIARTFGEKLSVGVGLSLYLAELKFKYRPDINFDSTGEAFGANVGATYRISEGQRLSVTYRSGFDVDLEGDFNAPAANIPPMAAMFGATPTSPFETEMYLPPMATIGYAFDPIDKLTIEINAEWIGHSENDQLTVDIKQNNILLNTPPSPEPLTLPQAWDDNWTVGLGLDYRLSDQLSLRAGYIYLDSPSPSATTIPVAAEADQHVVSVGAGYTHGAHHFDCAYAYGFVDDLTVSDHATQALVGAPSPLDGTYSFEAHLLSISYAYSF